MAFYTPLLANVGYDVVMLRAASAPETDGNWSETDGSVRVQTGGGKVKSLWSFPHSSDIYVVTQQEDGRVRLHIFDPGTDTWTTKNENVAEIGTPSAWTTAPFLDTFAVTIAIRSDGDIIVVYAGVNTTNDRRLFYRIRTGGTWGSAAEFSSTTTTLGLFSCVAIGPDSSDRITVCFKELSGLDLRTRSISSTDVLGTDTVVDGSIDAAAHVIGPGIVDSANQIFISYKDSTDDGAVAEWASAAAPTGITVHTGVSDNNVAVSLSAIMCLAVDGTDVHLLYADDATQDISHDDDVDGGGTTDTEIENTVTANRISCAVLGTNLDYVWLDGTTIKYGRVEFAAAPSGTAAQTLPSLTQAAVGVEKFVATSAQTLPSLGQQATVTMQPSATAAQSLPAITQVASLAEIFSATAAQSLPAITQVASLAEILSATAAQALPAITQQSVMLMQPSATAAQALPSITQVASLAEILSATAAQALPAITQQSVMLMQPSATAAQALPSLTQQASLTEIFSATAAQSLPAITQQSVMLMQPSATAAQSLPALTQVASLIHTENVTGTSAQALPSITQQGSLTEIFSATSAQALPAITQQASLAEIFSATAAQALPALTQVGSLAEIFLATAAQALPALTQVGSVDQIFSATAAQSLPAIEQAGIGDLSSGASGTAAQILPALRQGAIGVIVDVTFARLDLTTIGSHNLVLQTRGPHNLGLQTRGPHNLGLETI